MSNKRQQKKRGDDMSEAQKAALASFDDKKARREEIKHVQAEKHDDIVTNEVWKMKTDKAKVEQMKSHERLKTQVGMLSKVGLASEAEKIKRRLLQEDEA